jgi:Zn-dependent protease with chaperone function
MIKGFLYRKNSSLSKEAILSTLNDTFYIKVEEEVIFNQKINSLKISPRVANIQRQIRLKDDSLFITNDNNSVDNLLLKKTNILHKVESNLFLVFLSLISFIIFSGLFLKFGLPFLSQKIANNIPIYINKAIARNTLSVIDKYLLEKSSISDVKKKYLKNIFYKELIKKVQDSSEFKYNLLFRKMKIGNEDIANALALSDGTIIITDELIRVSQNDDELKSILLHEIGHVEEKHILKMLTQNSFTAVIVMILFGDTSTISDLGIGFGTILINSKHSRDIETQADNYSFTKMLKLKINPNSFISIMEKIDNHKKQKDNDVYLEYFSSHPNTQKRIKKAKIFKKCYDENKVTCI